MDHVFNANKTLNDGQQQLFQMLFDKQVPVIESKSFSVKNNMVDYLDQCLVAIDTRKIWPENIYAHNSNWYRNRKFEGDAELISFSVMSATKQLGTLYFDSISYFTQRHLEIEYNLESDGTLSDIKGKGNFDKDDLSHFIYYLSRLVHLTPHKSGDSSITKKGNLFLFTKTNQFKYKGHLFQLNRLILSSHNEGQTTDTFDPASFQIINRNNSGEIHFDKGLN
jgi:hypothetical protein